ncbi:hypothetical protein [Ideonella alba]|uniref:Uncharacterized protein n=1 Tax=Ideonella alba TaxID=2824118 RepID=A0A941BHP5_9BURK|nr:hypothetical protein [Ideonella alba]MBQ0931848.1 hypothetical protein [Ideonella alba]
MESRIPRQVAALAAVALAGSAWAVKVPTQDDFSTPGLNRALWIESEQGRFVQAKQLRLGRFTYGGAASDSGLVADTFNEPLIDTTAPKSMGADITVVDVKTDETCAANPFNTNARVRLIAAYFNQRPGGPVPGDRTGDVLAQIRLGRLSDTTLPAGQVDVQGILSTCSNADCSASTAIGVVNFAPVALGTKVISRVDWAKKAKTFDFTANGVTQTVSYTGSSATPPVLGFVQPSIRNEVANCLSTPKVKAGIVADFDNVRFSY